jgi:hypothetical protein
MTFLRKIIAPFIIILFAATIPSGGHEGEEAEAVGVSLSAQQKVALGTRPHERVTKFS